MKNLYFFIVVLFMSFSVKGQIVSITDVNFKNRLVNTNCAQIINNNSQFVDVDSNNDGEIQESEALAVISLNIDGASIISLTGIENFTNLESLNFEFNQVTSINLESLSHLKTLQCGANFLTEINLCGTIVSSLNCQVNHNLVNLYLKNNVISEIYIAGGESDSELQPTSFMLYDLPLLETICYDDGELPAIEYWQNSQNTNFVTDCVLNCSALKTDNPNSTEKFKIYPNPSKNSLNIETKQTIAIQNISIYNTLGQLMQTVSNQEFDKSIIIDVSQLKTGTYFITILSDKGKNVEKFMKL